MLPKRHLYYGVPIYGVPFSFLSPPLAILRLQLCNLT